jgi:hypothetical protein
MQAIPHGGHRQSGGAASARVGGRAARQLPAIGLLLCGCADAPAKEERERPPTPGCEAPAGVANQPRSIDETIALANALPKPLTLPCFVESLGRPLQLHATRSVFSAQPATGTRSPRIFLRFESLVMSVVPEGLGSELLELGEERGDFRSLKGELSFPIHEAVTPSLPYEKVVFSEELSACAFCHAAEERDLLVPGAVGYVSQALRPFSGQRIPLADLALELPACDVSLEPDRCALLDALFGWGAALDWDFPKEMATFGG